MKIVVDPTFEIGDGGRSAGPAGDAVQDIPRRSAGQAQGESAGEVGDALQGVPTEAGVKAYRLFSVPRLALRMMLSAARNANA